MNATDAAERLVERRLSNVTGIEPTLVDVAAAVLVERARAGALEATVRRVLGRAEAMSFAVGAALTRPDARALVDVAWNALGSHQRGLAMNAFGMLLAGIDVQWAWSLVETTVFDTGAGSLVAMLAEAAGVAPDLPTHHSAKIPALHLLRDAVLDPDAARAEVLARCQAGAWCSEAMDVQVFTLTACVLVDPGAALDLIVRHDLWLKHGDVANFLARELHARGRDAAWLATLPPAEPYYRRPGWLSCAIKEQILTGTRAYELVMEAFEAVSPNAEADEEAAECYPLLSAFVDLGRTTDLVAAADRVRMAPGLLADLLFWSDNARLAAAVIDSDVLERLTARPRDEWSAGRSWGPSWWYDALDARAVLETSKQVAALAGHTPWRDPPDGLERFIELLRSVSAGRS